MENSRRRTIFKVVLAAMIFGAILAVYLTMEFIAGRRIKATPDFAKAREILVADESAEGFVIDSQQNVVSQAYLLYVCAPNFEGFQHNEHGYRGPAIALERTPHVARILFLGGSTTYDWRCTQLESTYPEQVKAQLLKALPSDITGIEIINGGLPYGTTAEMLTHYMLKYRYYNPDIVVLNPGGNDAAQIRAHYQPDYSHSRQPIYNLRPLPPKSRWIMKSSIGALFMLQALQVEGVQQQRFYDEFRPPLINWFGQAKSDGGEDTKVPDAYWAFAHNLKTLLRAIQDDGGQCVLVPFRMNPTNVYSAQMRRESLREEEFLKEIAATNSIPLAPNPAEIVPEGAWADDCHTYAPGSIQKGKHVAEYVAPLLATIPRPIGQNINKDAPVDPKL